MELQDISNVIESILCMFDTETENSFSDKTALKLLELAFDKYHFKDSEQTFSNNTLRVMFERMSQVIEKDLFSTPKERLIKVLAAVYRSIQRRTEGGREYLTFVQQYVGTRVGPGIRILQ